MNSLASILSARRAAAIALALVLSGFGSVCAQTPAPEPEVISHGPTPSVALLINEKAAGLLAIIDPNSLEVVAEIPVGNQPHEVTTDGRNAYISNAGAGAMTVVDVANQKRLPSVDMGAYGSLHGLTVAGGKVYISHENSRILTRYNPEDGKIDWAMGTGFGSHLIQVTPDEKTIYLASNDATLMAIINSAHPISSSIATGRGGFGGGGRAGAAGRGRGGPGGPGGGAAAPGAPGNAGGPNLAGGPGGGGTPGGPGAAAGAGGRGGRAGGGRAGGGGGGFGGRGGITITTLPSGPRVEGFDISPDGQEFWAVNVGDSTVTVVNIPDRKVIDTFTLKSTYTNRLKFSLDGKYVFFSQLRDPELIVYDAKTRKEIKRIEVGAGGEGIFMDPNGGRAFYAVSSGNKVAVIDVNSLTVTKYIENLQNPDGMAWYVAR